MELAIALVVCVLLGICVFLLVRTIACRFGARRRIVRWPAKRSPDMMVVEGLQQRRSQLEQLMRGRVAMSHEEFGERFYSGGAVSVAARVRELVEEELGEDLSCALPDDCLIEDLGLSTAYGYGDEDEFVRADIEDEYDLQLPDERCERVKTLDDLIRLVVGEIEKRSRGGEESG